MQKSGRHVAMALVTAVRVYDDDAEGYATTAVRSCTSKEAPPAMEVVETREERGSGDSRGRAEGHHASRPLRKDMQYASATSNGAESCV